MCRVGWCAVATLHGASVVGSRLARKFFDESHVGQFCKPWVPARIKHPVFIVAFVPRLVSGIMPGVASGVVPSVASSLVDVGGRLVLLVSPIFLGVFKGVFLGLFLGFPRLMSGTLLGVAFLSVVDVGGHLVWLVAEVFVGVFVGFGVFLGLFLGLFLVFLWLLFLFCFLGCKDSKTPCDRFIGLHFQLPQIVE